MSCRFDPGEELDRSLGLVEVLRNSTLRGSEALPGTNLSQSSQVDHVAGCQDSPSSERKTENTLCEVSILGSRSFMCGY
jgi:hypothetical protein